MFQLLESGARGTPVGMNKLPPLGFVGDRHCKIRNRDAGRQVDILGVSTWIRYLQLCGESVPFPANGYRGDYVLPLAEQLLQRDFGLFQIRLAAEIVREQGFLQTRDEVPYGATVETESFKEKGGKIRIDAVIYVSRTGHKGILIGAKGARIRDIGARARAELTKLLDTKVDLFLRVAERPGWDEEAARIRATGLTDPKA